MQKPPLFLVIWGETKRGGNEPYLQETDLTLKYGSSWPLGQVKNRYLGELNKMAKKPLNPDSTAGNARLGIGRGSNAGRSQKSGANKAVPTPKKFSPPVSTAKKAQAATRLATKSNVSVERVFPSGAYRVTDLDTFRTKQFMGYTKSEAIKRFIKKAE